MPQASTEKVVGILGGMGPEATVDLMQRIIRLTPAKDDNDHIRCIIDNNPKVPSRIKAIIEGSGESPGPCLALMASKLEAWGADLLVIPCNTAHAYFQEVQSAVRIPVVNVIELTVKTVVATYPGVRRVGLLASPAVRMVELYEKLFTPLGVDVVYPGPVDQELLFGVIKDVKAGICGETPRNLLGEVAGSISSQEVDVLIVACTELSAIADFVFPIPMFDAAELLAKEIVAIVKQKRDE